jgi:hypothetical protein
MASAKKAVPSERPETRAGTHLSSEYEEALAKEAAAGFDPAGLVRRRPGRPSLAGGPGHSSRLGLRLDHDTYQTIRQLAERQHRKVSDVREAINRYLEAS